MRCCGHRWDYFDDETITVYDSQGFDRPLQLTADEIATLLVGLRALQQLPDVDAATVASCIEKLSTDGHSASDLMVNVTTPNAASIVAEAIRENRDLEIEYLHPLRDDTTLRTITPLRLFSATGADYVEAWCHTAEAHRTFRIDRIESAERFEELIVTGPIEVRSICAHHLMPIYGTAIVGVLGLRELSPGLRAQVLRSSDDVAAAEERAESTGGVPERGAWRVLMTPRILLPTLGIVIVAMFIPALIGMRVYIGLSEVAFRRVVLTCLTASGVALLASSLPTLLTRM